MKDIEIVLQGSINRLLSEIWDTFEYDCINLYMRIDKIHSDYFAFDNLVDIMNNQDNNYNAVYVLINLTKEEEDKYLALLSIGINKEELFQSIYDKYKDNPTNEY